MQRKRLRIGQKFRGIPVAWLNSLHDDIEKLRQQTGAPPGPETERPPGIDRPQMIVPVKNTTSQNLVERSIMGVSDSGFTPPAMGAQGIANAAILGAHPLEITTPDSSVHGNGRLVVTLGPIPANG